MIKAIHLSDDYQSNAYKVGVASNQNHITAGQGKVISIERFNINGEMADYPRLRVTFELGATVELDEAKHAIYEVKETPNEVP